MPLIGHFLLLLVSVLAILGPLLVLVLQIIEHTAEELRDPVVKLQILLAVLFWFIVLPWMVFWRGPLFKTGRSIGPEGGEDDGTMAFDPTRR